MSKRQCEMLGRRGAAGKRLGRDGGCWRPAENQHPVFAKAPGQKMGFKRRSADMRKSLAWVRCNGPARRRPASRESNDSGFPECRDLNRM